MNKLFNKLKSHSHSQSKFSLDPNEPIAPQDIYRYRQQRGVNLGSWFVLERWIADEPFQCAKAPAQSDLDVAHGQRAKQILEHHWDAWIQEEDWKWIAARGINSVRIPIGYYHLCGIDPTVLHGTDFQPFHEVYSGAWQRITQAIQRAASYDIGVLIDLHAAPGKQNNDSHAGTSDKANFFNDPHNQKHTIHFTNSFDPPLLNIIGIELINEPCPPSDHALQTWYSAYADFISHLPTSSALTVLDHHLYRCFTSSDISASAEDHARSLADPSATTPRMLASAAEKAGRAGGGIVIGEWSGALNPGSLRGVPGEQKSYVNAQLNLFERVCAGWFFWTYKKQHPGDTGWSFRDAVERNIFPSFVGIKPRTLTQEEYDAQKAARDSMKDKALAEHVGYWSKYPGKYDHSRFAEGYTIGWDDAFTFICSTASSSKTINQIGFKGAWARKRTQDHGKNYWEFETGFIQAANEATAYYNQR
ncbi:glycoside hydrolase superfamily [Flammula alnicola]|nr:glycoside hydrolase superfamily [Flammula alnicola]